jgi:ABC-type polysaccharide/polyol phosphate export systems, permease component
MNMTQDVSQAFRTSAARLGPIALVGQALGEIRSRRRLIEYLARADMKQAGANTLFGNIWWILDPLLQMIVYVILVTVIFQRDVPAYPLFIFAAILPWKWFTTSIGDAITSVSGKDRLIKQVQFPKLVLPLSALLSAIAQFVFGLIPLLVMMLVLYPSRLSPALAWIPVVAFVQFVFTVALGLMLASLNVFFRDIGNLSRHLLRLWFYLSPALYGEETVQSLSVSHPTIGTIMRLNPFYAILNGYRDAIYFGKMPDLASLSVVLAISSIGLVVAVWFFKRVEPAFAKVL